MTVDGEEIVSWNTMMSMLRNVCSLTVKNKDLMANGGQEDIYTHPHFQSSTLNIEQVPMVPMLPASSSHRSILTALPTSQVRQEEAM